MTGYQEKLSRLMDEYVHFAYSVSRNFPKEELYGSISQWRRATLSIMLNYIEGYARKKPLVQLNFLETSFGSFKESQYLLHFFKKMDFLKEQDYNNGNKLSEEIGAMLWAELKKLENSIHGTN